jgi:hypothetical protein
MPAARRRKNSAKKKALKPTAKKSRGKQTGNKK